MNRDGKIIRRMNTDWVSTGSSKALQSVLYSTVLYMNYTLNQFKRLVAVKSAIFSDTILYTYSPVQYTYSTVQCTLTVQYSVHLQYSTVYTFSTEWCTLTIQTMNAYSTVHCKSTVQYTVLLQYKHCKLTVHMYPVLQARYSKT